MRVIICGGRHYRFNAEDRRWLDEFHAIHRIIEVLHGGASGADTDGGAWATAHDIPVKVFDADWARHGKLAGPIRNKAMLEYLLRDFDYLTPRCVIPFPGGLGTGNMIALARRDHVRIVEPGSVLPKETTA